MKISRIAYVLNIFPKLSETFIAGELAELRRRGIDLRILSLLPPRDEPQHDIICRAGLDRITAYDVSGFSRVIEQFQPQIIHAHFAKEATEKARDLSIDLGIPYCFTAHGYDIHRKPPPDFHERAMAARAVITVSRSNAEYITNTFNVPEDHLRVIPCGVDLSTFVPQRRSGKNGTGPLIVCVARAVEVKKLSLLLKSCALLKSRGVPFRCIYAGDGPLRESLLRYRAQLGLEDLVEMPGGVNQERVLELWQQADIGVLTSDNEGMPVCLMEAAACGVPIVATAVGGVPELVQDGTTGLLCGRGDASGIADALQLLLTEPQLRLRMGGAARLRAEERFSVARQVDALLRVWSEAQTPVPA